MYFISNVDQNILVLTAKIIWDCGRVIVGRGYIYIFVNRTLIVDRTLSGEFPQHIPYAPSDPTLFYWAVLLMSVIFFIVLCGHQLSMFTFTGQITE